MDRSEIKSTSTKCQEEEALVTGLLLHIAVENVVVGRAEIVLSDVSLVQQRG